MKFKILIADPIEEICVNRLKKFAEVKFLEDKSKLLEEIKDVDAIIVRSATKITKEVISRAERLKVIARAGVGVDNIDLNEATKRGIVVINAPDASSVSVAEHTIGLMLALARNLIYANNSLKNKKWEKKKLKGIELRGKTLGIIGLGRIGSQVAKRAKAFEMRVIAYDPYVTKEYANKLGVELVDFETLLKESDFITIHVPLTEKTKNMITKKEIEKMKDGVFIINCARGGIINENDLYEALKNGKVAGAALDVFEKEPPFDSPLLKLDNVIVTPHIGGNTKEAQKLACLMICEDIERILNGEPPKNPVNFPVIDKESMERLKYILALAEKAGRFVQKFSNGEISRIEIFVSKEFGEEDLKMITNALLKGYLSEIVTTGVNILNSRTLARNRGMEIIEGKKDITVYGMQTIMIRFLNHELLVGCRFDEQRILRFDGYNFNIPFENNILIVKIEDKPGMIGKVTTFLGENGINIAYLQVSRKESENEQVMIIITDQEIRNEIVDSMKNLDGVKYAKFSKL